MLTAPGSHFTAQAICEQADQAEARRLQGPVQGCFRPLLLRGAVEAIQRHRLRFFRMRTMIELMMVPN